MVKLANTVDSKSIAVMACGFDSLYRHHKQTFFKERNVEMKRMINVVAVLAMVVALAGCGISMDTIKYANGTKKQVQVEECVVEVLAPEPVVIPPKVTKINILEPVMFDWDKSVIRADQEIVIDKVAALMKEYPDTMLALKGHASVEGTDKYNLALSQRRADAVKAALVAEGVASDRIVSAMGEGETSVFGDILKSNRRVMVLSVE
jgi:outer membrane protein OmpA-like peptidoglycan-associated protein